MASPGREGTYGTSPYFEGSKRRRKANDLASTEEVCPSPPGSCRQADQSRVCGEEFYDVPCEELAMRLLGQHLVRVLEDGTRLSGEIVETECYPGGDDAASHSFNGKRTERNRAMFMKPGTAYVYYIYGMYNCFNISSQGEGAAVLIRALKPLEGLDTMQQFRAMKRNGDVNKKGSFKEVHLCNGPSKLCQALKIEKNTANTENLTKSDFLWLEKGNTIDKLHLVKTQRIGINSSGEESVKKLLRFYILDHPCVSVRDKQAEELLRASHQITSSEEK